MSTPLVSVCMPVSRSAAHVKRSLNSVLAQSFTNIEILVSDDGRYGREVVEEAGDPRVRYRRNAVPLGLTGNLESLLAEAQGEMIAFLHDDDHWEPSYLEEAVDRLQASPQAGMVLTACREAHSGSIAAHPPSGCYADALPVLLDERCNVLPSAMVVRRTIIPAARLPMPELSCGDMAFFLDAAVAGWGLTVIGTALVLYTRHPDQLSAQEVRFREDLAALFASYHFKDPVAEQLRRRRLARSRLSIARAHLKGQRATQVRVSVAGARASDRDLRMDLEGMALLALSSRPRLLNAILRAWYAVRGQPPTMGD
jgi:glycosyltransferase involved in cell wall biosynthesis